jgi:hypothetical protein
MISHSDPLDPAIFEPLLNAYQRAKIPIYGERKNSGKGQSQSIGILSRRNYGIGYSRNNLKYAEILREARALAKIICPQINYTTMMLNVNYEASEHRDKNNIGPSCVVAFGEFEGGKLKIEGTEYDICHRPFTFEAAESIHSVSPITSGTRYSIVFFRQRFPQRFYDRYGKTLDYDSIAALIPSSVEGQPASSVKIPV